MVLRARRIGQREQYRLGRETVLLRAVLPFPVALSTWGCLMRGGKMIRIEIGLRRRHRSHACRHGFF